MSYSKRIHFKQAFCSGALAPQCITRGESLISSMVQIQCMLSWYIISSCLTDASNKIGCQKCMGHLKNIFAGFCTTNCHSRLILKPFFKPVLYITGHSMTLFIDMINTCFIWVHSIHFRIYAARNQLWQQETDYTQFGYSKYWHGEVDLKWLNLSQVWVFHFAYRRKF